MKRQIKLIFMLIKMKLSHMMVFRLSFFEAFFVDGTLFAVQMITFSAIYGNVDTIGGWSRGEMIVFIGTFSLINALNMLIYFFGVVGLPYKIINGDLDHYLTKPMNPLLRLTFENVNPGSVPLVIASIAIVAYGAAQLEHAVTLPLAAGYIFLVLIMTLLWYDVELIIRVIPFYVSSAYRIDRIEDLLELNFKVPGVLYKGVFKLLFYFVLPYGIMSTIPTQMIAGTLALTGFIYGVFVVALFTVLALKLWKHGLKHYKSASS